MKYEELLAYLQAKPGSAASYPFDETARVYKVGNKMFAIVADDADPLRISLKCDPDESLALRAQYEAIIPGYHLDKRHWNTLILNQSLKDKLVRELIDKSYDLIVASLPKRVQNTLKAA